MTIGRGRHGVPLRALIRYVMSCKRKDKGSRREKQTYMLLGARRVWCQRAEELDLSGSKCVDGCERVRGRELNAGRELNQKVLDKEGCI